MEIYSAILIYFSRYPKKMNYFSGVYLLLVLSVDWSKEMLNKYDRDASKHFYDIAYEPESEQQLTVWVFQDEPNPTKVSQARSTLKEMITCLFGKTGHFAIVPLEQRRTVNSE